MEKTKYYAVAIGVNPGIYTSWESTKKQVLKFSGAIYKSFDTKEDAVSYLIAKKAYKIYDEDIDENITLEPLSPEKFPSDYKTHLYIATTNIKGEHYYSFAIIDSEKDELIYSDCNKVVDTQKIPANSIIAEIAPTISGLQICSCLGLFSVMVFHEYVGIEKFATKEYKATKEGTNYYSEEFNKLVNATKMDIGFTQINPKSEEKWIEFVDDLFYEHDYK